MKIERDYYNKRERREITPIVALSSGPQSAKQQTGASPVVKYIGSNEKRVECQVGKERRPEDNFVVPLRL